MRHTTLLDLLDKHPASCPHCNTRKAAFLITPEFEGFWRCAACGHVWRADENVNAVLTATPKTIH
jgi:rubredoxin